MTASEHGINVKHKYLSNVIADMFLSLQKGEDETGVHVECDLNDLRPRDETLEAPRNRRRWLRAARWIPFALLLSALAAWTQLGSRVHPFRCIGEILWAFWPFKCLSPSSSVTCLYLEFLHFQVWLTF